MFDPIIGGGISAVIGALAYAGVAFWIELKRNKVQRLLIVDELIVETQENLVIAKSPVTRKMWWMVPYKLEAYQAHKGQLFFLPKEVRVRLSAIALLVEGVNTGIRVFQLRAAFGQPVEEKPIDNPQELVGHMEFCSKELIKWRKQH